MLAQFQELPARIEALGPHIVKAGDRADALACEIIELLKEIRDATSTGYGVDVFEYPRLPFTGAGAKVHEGREGYVKIIKQVAIVGAAATNVDLYIGEQSDSNFVERITLGAAGRFSEAMELPVPEGQQITVVSDAAAQVNLIVQRIKL